MKNNIGLASLLLFLGSLVIPTFSQAAPDYKVVFREDQINEFKIVIEPNDWTAMQDNMLKLYGEPGAMPGPIPGQGPGQPGTSPGPGNPGIGFPTENPMWVNGKIYLNGELRSDVAIRYKGNSSLMSAWKSGSPKLPFKINFAKFEPQKKKFHGFKEISLSNNTGDPTFLREVLAYRILDTMGLPASRTAHYNVSVEYGDGIKNYGIYTAIEVTNDTVIDEFFGEDQGNIYEGDGQGVTLAKTLTTDQIKEAFQKENNEKEADWSDILELHTVLHDPTRLSNPLVWRTDLERIFGVNDFLKWLALSAVLEHWDTYGGMTHNFYLYNQNGKINWISWDHNLILGAEMGMPQVETPKLPRPPGGGPSFGKGTFDKSEITDKWPLIRFLLDDPIYNATYKSQLEKVRDSYFDASQIEAELNKKAKIIEPVLPAGDKTNFATSLDKLIKKVYERQQKLVDYLKTRSTEK